MDNQRLEALEAHIDAGGKIGEPTALELFRAVKSLTAQRDEAVEALEKIAKGAPRKSNYDWAGTVAKSVVARIKGGE